MKLPRVHRDRGYYLRIFRATYKLSQAEAARLFGLSPSHWSLMEDGKRCASPEVAQQLAKVTDGPIEVFLGLTVRK